GHKSPLLITILRLGKPADLFFTTKIVSVLIFFLFTGRKKSLFYVPLQKEAQSTASYCSIDDE
ncbi:MAG: hypothetical protein PUD91_04155, partial [Bacteroidales bacterium]|nr:hypothetical protein [Bacteroidales bacterium]